MPYERVGKAGPDPVLWWRTLRKGRIPANLTRKKPPYEAVFFSFYVLALRSQKAVAAAMRDTRANGAGD